MEGGAPGIAEDLGKLAKNFRKGREADIFLKKGIELSFAVLADGGRLRGKNGGDLRLPGSGWASFSRFRKHPPGPAPGADLEDLLHEGMSQIRQTKIFADISLGSLEDGWVYSFRRYS
jgi:hypothetical protein